MNSLAKYYIIAFLVSVLLMSAAPMRADVNSVTTSPTSKNVSMGRYVSVPIVWTIDEDIGPVTVTSTSGEFRPAIGSPVLLGTVSKVLSKTVSSPAMITFSETVQVPRSVIFRARKMGFSSLVYQRTFSDGIAPGTGGITLNITGSGGADFSINRISLRFDDDSPVRLLPRGEKLITLAEITFGGTGLIKAVWEIADPSSTPGVPVYRPLRIVRQQLTASRKVTLSSPELPTDRIGIHLVRLRITDPEVGFDTPVLRYFVAKEKPDTPRPPVPIRLIAPGPVSQLTPETNFSWLAVKDTLAYQLELYVKRKTPVSGQPVTGMLIPARQKETPLSQIARQHLKAGQVYLWRVVAIGENGAIIGKSPLREIHAP